MWSIVLTLTLAGAPLQGPPHELSDGIWRAWLDSPGGDLPFGIEFQKSVGGPKAWIINGQERIAVPGVAWEGEELVMDIDHYDSKIRAKVGEGGRRLDGQWTKRRGSDRWTKMAFHATAGVSSRFDIGAGRTSSPPLAGVDGRWSVDFSSSPDPAVGVFTTYHQGSASGTFMTTTGDYRYLDGNFDGKKLRLSCFDGAHAFLFHADLKADGTLKGDFWSSDSWHETWSAKRDEQAALPDAWLQTQWTGKVPLGKVAFPDLEGKRRALDDPALAGKARIILIFGSWCPNCHDHGELLAELDRRYRDRGLSILGLAFEHTGDFRRDSGQVRKYIARHNVTYPVLIAGLSDKAKASEAFPLLDRIRSFPTTIFMDADGKVRGVHTGYTGPATGDAYSRMRTRFESLVEQMLSDAKPGKS